MRVKSKQQLLRLLKKWNACGEAISWVRSIKSDSAAKIVDICHREDWLEFLLYNGFVQVKFGQVCQCCQLGSRYHKRAVKQMLLGKRSYTHK